MAERRPGQETADFEIRTPGYASRAFKLAGRGLTVRIPLRRVHHLQRLLAQILPCGRPGLRRRASVVGPYWFGPPRSPFPRVFIRVRPSGLPTGRSRFTPRCYTLASHVLRLRSAVSPQRSASQCQSWTLRSAAHPIAKGARHHAVSGPVARTPKRSSDHYRARRSRSGGSVDPTNLLRRRQAAPVTVRRRIAELSPGRRSDPEFCCAPRLCSPALRSEPTPPRRPKPTRAWALEPVRTPPPHPKARRRDSALSPLPERPTPEARSRSGPEHTSQPPKGPPRRPLQLARPTAVGLGLPGPAPAVGRRLPEQVPTIDGTRCVVSSATQVATEAAPW